MNISTTTFPLLLAYDIYYTENAKVYLLPGDRKRIPLTEDELNIRLQKGRKNGTQSMLLYDYMYILKRDVWEASPEKIDIDEIEFLYHLSILDDVEYMNFKYLHSEYGNKMV